MLDHLEQFCRCCRLVDNFIVTSVACAIGPIVNSSSTDFSFQNLVFWNLFEFSAAKIT
jgi:hypothetical protein